MDQVRSRPDLCGAFCMNGDKERAQPSRPRKKSPPDWVVIFGAGDEARTRYLDLGKVALYQMSYARKRKVNYTAYFPVCQPCIFILRIL